MKFLLASLIFISTLCVTSPIVADSSDPAYITVPDLCQIFSNQGEILAELKFEGATNVEMEVFVFDFVIKYPEYEPFLPGYGKIVETLNRIPPENQGDINSFKRSVNQVCNEQQGEGWFDSSIIHTQSDKSTVNF